MPQVKTLREKLMAAAVAKLKLIQAPLYSVSIRAVERTAGSIPERPTSPMGFIWEGPEETRQDLAAGYDVNTVELVSVLVVDDYTEAAVRGNELIGDMIRVFGADGLLVTNADNDSICADTNKRGSELVLVNELVHAAVFWDVVYWCKTGDPTR